MLMSSDYVNIFWPSLAYINIYYNNTQTELETEIYQ